MCCLGLCMGDDCVESCSRGAANRMKFYVGFDVSH